MRSASSAVVTANGGTSHHSIGFISSGGAMSRATTTVRGGAKGGGAERCAGRAISTTVVRHAHVASRARWPGLAGTVTVMVPIMGAAAAAAQRCCFGGSLRARSHAAQTNHGCREFRGAINRSSLSASQSPMSTVGVPSGTRAALCG
jgi:hypothetical protein